MIFCITDSTTVYATHIKRWSNRYPPALQQHFHFSHFLGINGAVGCGGDSSSGRLISGDSEPWGVDENPRLDDYFRGQVNNAC